MKKRFLLKLLLTLIAIFFGYILFILYIIGGDTKDYEKACSPYIPVLGQYHQRHGVYPSILERKQSKMDFNLSLEECGYQLLDDGNFSFYFSEGLGVGGYNSANGQWWHD